MKHLYYTFLVTAITITSCKNNETEKTQTNPRVIVPFTQQTAAAMQDQTVQTPGPRKHNFFHENNTAIKPSVLAGINPEHGQPNHRCDIAVGAPLNTAVGGGASPQPTSIQPTQGVTSSQNVTASTVTPKGMNPPHGEKNHRCDIAVGAPLNSKPKATATTTEVNSATTEPKDYTVQQAVPALLSTAAADTETPEGMNPAHGKTGHRCDIAVGAPLPKS